MKKHSKPAARRRASSRRSPSLPENGLQVVFTEKQIHKRVQELADEINRDYRGKVLHVIGILENCFVFMADLLRGVKIPVVCHFMKMEAHDRPMDRVDVRELIYTPKVDVAGKDVLMVEGVVQSGVVQDHLYRYLLGQEPSSLRAATLVDKTDERKVEVKTEYMGFKTSSSKFLVGYGLGYQARYRNLPYIAALS